MKRLLAVMMFLSILTLSSRVFADYQDLPKNAVYAEAVERVISLGLMDCTGNNIFSPGEDVTRAEFAKLIAIAAGLSDEAEVIKGITLYSDAPADNEYNGYINVAISKGLMAGLADGKFHSNDPVTYAQAVTGMVRALGYTDDDIPGVWPKNYIEKAKSLGFTKELSYNAASGVPRWVMAQMTDCLLDMNLKPSDAQDGAKTLAEASGLTAATMYSVYSKPQIYYKSALKGKKLGNVDLSGRLTIVRNSVDNNTSPAMVITGEEIEPGEIKELNVVYEVSDRFGINKYVLVIENQVTGSITGILPNKFTPQSVEIDGVSYELDGSFDIAGLTGTGSFSLNDAVTLLLGYDGKVVDIQGSTYVDNANFAFVMNYSVSNYTVASENKTSSERQRYVKLLLTSGAVKTFETSTNASSMKGKVVTYFTESDGSVKLVLPTYQTSVAMTVDKENRKILYGTKSYNNDVAGNVKIFSLISSGADTEADAQAELVSWSEMPSGTMKAGKVLHLNKTGIFEDINVIFMNNIKTDEYYLGFIKEYVEVPADEDTKDEDLYKYTIVVGGKNYTFICDYFINVDTVVMVTMTGNSISEIIFETVPDTEATTIQALNQDRIRVNQRTYMFSDKISIYKIEDSGELEVIKLAQLWNEASGTIYLYTDTDIQLGGKVELIVIEDD